MLYCSSLMHLIMMFFFLSQAVLVSFQRWIVVVTLVMVLHALVTLRQSAFLITVDTVEQSGMWRMKSCSAQVYNKEILSKCTFLFFI